MLSKRNETKRTTLKEIARYVGVSANAVSKVLNDTRSSAHVSEHTRQRILDAAKELNYQPNLLARSLLSQKTDIICLYFESNLNTGEPFIAAVLYGAEQACKERKQSLLIYSRRVGQSADEVYQKLADGIIDGVIVPEWADAGILERLETFHLPVVYYPLVHPEFPSLTIDEISGARQVIQHLKEKGHSNILFHAFPNIGAVRVQAFCAAAAEAKMDMKVMPAADVLGNISDEEKKLIHLPIGERPTAVACWNDEFAYQFMYYCADNGIRVPEDLAIVGFDNAHAFPLPAQRLTTVDAHWNELARCAVLTLADLCDGKDVPSVQTLAVELIPGETT